MTARRRRRRPLLRWLWRQRAAVITSAILWGGIAVAAVHLL